MINNSMKQIIILLLAFSFFTACQNNPAPKEKVVTENTTPPAPAKPTKLPAEKLDSGDRIIYLTFDDGPLPGSEALVRLIKEHQFKASVFIVGKHSKNNRSSPRIIQDFKNSPLVDVCNHSYTHANNNYDKFYRQPDSAAADIIKCQNEIGFDHKIVRLPGRQLWMLPERDLNMKVSSAGPMAGILKKDSFKIIGWDIEWNNKNNAPKESPEDIMAKIDDLFKKDMTFTRNHLVILSHDVMFSKPEGEAALLKLVSLLREKKYKLENIRHYPDKDVF
jgi:peptidoglycan-N-acetylglucosamine deacetylase